MSTRRRIRSSRARPDRPAGQQRRHQRAEAELGRHGCGGWDKVVDINLNGVFIACARCCRPCGQQDGCIINVASWAAVVSKMPGPAYTTTKHAVLALTHSFNMDECANGLRACCLSPGEVATRS
jgi:NAD(P)-dependent dehydrogenase (short-subunit alcohol dehydrogenase family)